jgi:hypothetical protein
MIDPELAAVIEAWDGLPEAVRAGIVAMVKAAAAVKDRGRADGRGLRCQAPRIGRHDNLGDRAGEPSVALTVR